MGLFEDRATRLALRWRAGAPRLDIRREHPQLAERLALSHAAMPQVLQALSQAAPVPRTFLLPGDGHFYRLAQHNRSFCYAADDGEDVFSSPTLVFKGAEPLIDDCESILEWMAVAPFRRSSRVMASHFPLAEGKIPAALSLQEAVREFSMAAELQHKHLSAYGEPAHLPTPIAVYELSEQERGRFDALLRRILAPPALDRVEPLLRTGLAIYCYHYPASPIRANARASGMSPGLTRYLGKAYSPAATIAGWLRLTARLCYLGYLPVTPWSEGLGACIDFGNATLDGGFCDLDSIVPISACPDAEFFFESVARTLAMMQSTIARLISPSGGLQPNDLHPSIEPFVIARFVCDQFERALESEARPGLVLDERLRKALIPKTLEEVGECLERRPRPAAFQAYARRSTVPGAPC